MNRPSTFSARLRTPVRLDAAWPMLAVFWLLMLGMLLFDWNFGVYRGGMLLVFGALAVLCLRGDGRGALAPPPVVLYGLIGVLLAAHAAYLGVRLAHVGHLSDIAGTTLSAARSLAAGVNPYRAVTDTSAAALAAHTLGYKYLPVMPLVYAPLALLLAENGMILTNFALDCAIALAVCLLARRAKGRTAALIATALYLSLPLVLSQLYAKGVTDFVPIAFMLGAMLALDRRPFVAGLLMGLSISSKLLPGLGALPAFVPTRGRLSFVLGLLAGFVPTAIAFASAPQAFAENIIRFNFVRAVSSTSWMDGMAPIIVQLGRAGLGVMWVTLAVAALLFAKQPAARCALVVLMLIVVILAGPGSQQNYIVWWTPFLCVALAAQTVRASMQDRQRQREPLGA